MKGIFIDVLQVLWSGYPPSSVFPNCPKSWNLHLWDTSTSQ